jgi:hypothetical protein
VNLIVYTECPNDLYTEDFVSTVEGTKKIPTDEKRVVLLKVKNGDTRIFFSKADLTRQSFVDTLYIIWDLYVCIFKCK